MIKEQISTRVRDFKTAKKRPKEEMARGDEIRSGGQGWRSLQGRARPIKRRESVPKQRRIEAEPSKCRRKETRERRGHERYPIDKICGDVPSLNFQYQFRSERADWGTGGGGGARGARGVGGRAGMVTFGTNQQAVRYYRQGRFASTV